MKKTGNLKDTRKNEHENTSYKYGTYRKTGIFGTYDEKPRSIRITADNFTGQNFKERKDPEEDRLSWMSDLRVGLLREWNREQNNNSLKSCQCL